MYYPICVANKRQFTERHERRELVRRVAPVVDELRGLLDVRGVLVQKQPHPVLLVRRRRLPVCEREVDGDTAV